MLQHLPDLMKKTLSPIVLNQGQILYARGDVKLKISEGMVKGRVHEKGRGLFDVFFDLRTWPSIPARCSCQSPACEHLAGCLYDILFKKHLADDQQLAFLKISQQQLVKEPSAPFVISEWHHMIRTDAHDFFSYQLEVDIAGVHVDLVPFVAQWVASGAIVDLERYVDEELIELPVMVHYITQTIRVPFGTIKPLLRFFLHFGLKKTEQLSLNRYQLVALSQDLSSHVQWKIDKTMMQNMRDILEMDYQTGFDAPIALRASLRDYQKVSLSWMDKLRKSGFGGVLADDMGLGKTIQTLSHLLRLKEDNQLRHASLIIVPMSLVMNWYEECQRFSPDLSMLIYHGGTRHGLDLSRYDVIVTTYGVVVRDLQQFLEYHFDTVILDEAQAIKNAMTKVAYAVRQLKADHRLCLTGTPLENHLGELWSLFHFLMPGFLGDMRQFKQYFRNPIEKHGDQACRELLAKRLKPFLLRRRKEDVEQELPEKTEIIQKITLSQDQRYLYEAIRMTMEERVRLAIARSGFQKSRIVLLDALLKLRQICCDPRLLKMPSEDDKLGCSSAKLDFLLSLLDELVDEGRRILVFSQFTSMLALIESALIERKISFLTLTGKTKNRHHVVNAFQEGQGSVFLVSLKAGGVGLNLTKADVVVHYDPWWNPQVEDQATDRTHRIGQCRPVFVYKLVAEGTVEEAILMMQSKKRTLFEGVFDENPVAMQKLNEQDLLALFKPLGNY